MEKSCRKYASKVSPRPLFNFAKQPKTAIACKKFFFKIRYFESRLSKILNKVNFIFSFKPSPFQWTRLSKTNRVWN